MAEITPASEKELLDMFENYVDWGLANLYKNGTPEQLHDFIFNTMGFNIPTVNVCSDHCAPFDFVRDTFFDLESMFLVVANRNGGKTQNFGIINCLDALCKNRCEIVSVGAIEEQAQKCYKYSRDIFTRPYYKKYLAEPPRISKTMLSNHSELAILPGTPAAVNGPHPVKANFDEVELTQWRILQEFLSMPKSTKTIPASVRLTSTRKYAYGPMQKLIDEREERGLKMYTWCIFETMEQCMEERHGRFKVTVRQEDKKTNKTEIFTAFTDTQTDADKVYSLDNIIKNREKYTGCMACPLLEVCRTKAIRSRGYYSITDTINKFKSMDRETWDNQWECRRPGTHGLVYTEFDELVHVIPAGQYVPSPANMILCAWDPGYEDPFAVVWIEFKPNGDAIIFDELYVRHKQSPVFIIQDFKPKYVKNFTKGAFGDPENADVFAQVEEAGIEAIVPDKHIEVGIAVVRQWLRTADGYVRLYVTSNCTNTIREFKSYRYPELGGNKPKDADNHLMDCVRYVLYNVDEFGHSDNNVQVDIF